MHLGNENAEIVDAELFEAKKDSERWTQVEGISETLLDQPENEILYNDDVTLAVIK